MFVKGHHTFFELLRVILEWNKYVNKFNALSPERHWIEKFAMRALIDNQGHRIHTQNINPFIFKI